VVPQDRVKAAGVRRPASTVPPPLPAVPLLPPPLPLPAVRCPPRRPRRSARPPPAPPAFRPHQVHRLPSFPTTRYRDAPCAAGIPPTPAVSLPPAPPPGRTSRIGPAVPELVLDSDRCRPLNRVSWREQTARVRRIPQPQSGQDQRQDTRQHASANLFGSKATLRFGHRIVALQPSSSLQALDVVDLARQLVEPFARGLPVRPS
jgi:hypothetical protein